MNTRPTMADVATAAGVSPMSVSYTYNQPGRVSDATRRRVLAAAADLGYSGPNRAARSLRSGKTNNLGVVLTEKLTYSFENPQARAFLSGIAEACLDTDAGLVLLPNSREDSDLDRVRSAHVDGFVMWTTVTGDPMLDVAVDTGKPVCIQGGPAHRGAGLVGIDDIAAAHAVGLAGLSRSTKPGIVSFPRDRHRTAEIVCGPEPTDAAFPVTAARLEGYRRAVVEIGGDWAGTPVAFVADNSRRQGADAAESLLGLGVDAMLCTSDELAFGVLDTAPRAVVTGWDDSAAAEAAGLTTVTQSLHEQGHAAAKWVLGTLKEIPRSHWSLALRSSTSRGSSFRSSSY